MKAISGSRFICECGANMVFTNEKMNRIKCSNVLCKNSKKIFETPTVTLKEIKSKQEK